MMRNQGLAELGTMQPQRPGDILGWLGGDDASAPGATEPPSVFLMRILCQCDRGHCRVIDGEGALIMMHISSDLPG